MKISPDDPRITACALGELKPEEKVAFEAALKSSPDGQQEVEALRRLARNLTDTLNEEPCPALTHEQGQALRQLTHSAQTQTASSVFAAWLRPLLWGIGTATALCLLYFMTRPATPPAETRSTAAATPKQQASPQAANQSKGTMVALNLNLPHATLKGTPEDLPSGPNLEPLSDAPRPAFLVPLGTENMALTKPVTASTNVITGDLTQITDGEKEAFDEHVVEMRKGLQYVQIDLLEPCKLYALVFWNDHRYIQIYHQVILLVADDPAFTKNVRILFNNDYENKAGFGVGLDKEYFETRQGRLVNGKGTVARYIRWYSKGSNLSALNGRTEIEVYGMPAREGL